ncbi:molybdopterin-dependent oxidoreductase, partial [Xanthomonas citri pv. citri]
METTVRRTNTEQRVALGADKDGKIHTIIHNSIVTNLPSETFFEPVAVSTHFLYGGDNRQIKYEMARMNFTLTGSMRAPGEAVGQLALECAMDELAHALKLCPIELRKRNEPSEDPSKKIPYSTRKLLACME